MFDISQTKIYTNKFKYYDWQDFYRYVEEVIPLDVPEARELHVTLSLLVDTNLAGDNANHGSQTRILMFINISPIYQNSKRKPTVEASPFSAEF